MKQHSRYLALLALLALPVAAQAHVDLVLPNGGEVLEVGSTYTVEWRVRIQHNTENWDLLYSTTGAGGPWLELVSDLPVGDPTVGSLHTYDWTIPNQVTDLARVKIVQDNFAGDYEDISDSEFSIVAIDGEPAYLAIDMKQSTYGRSARALPLIGDSPLILNRILLKDPEKSYFAITMTVDLVTGAQMGEKLSVPLSPALTGQNPIDLLWSEYFFPGEVIVLNDDQSMLHFPVTIGTDGTPSAGNVSNTDPKDDGSSVSFTEVSGLDYPDGLPRLVIGTSGGDLVSLKNDPFDGVLLDDIHTISSDPIDDLVTIPMFGYTAVVAVTGGTVYATDPKDGGIRRSGPENFHIWSLADPRPSPVVDLDFYTDPKDNPTTDPDAIINLVIANGTNELVLTSVVASQVGDETMNVSLIDPKDTGVGKVATGSLLTLSTDSGSVDYDPQFDPETGSSGCELDIMDDVLDECTPPPCCGLYTDGQTGNTECDIDGKRNLADITRLINNVYISKLALCCPENGNTDGDALAKVNLADITRLIDHVYISKAETAACE